MATPPPPCPRTASPPSAPWYRTVQGAASGHYLLVEEGHECVLHREMTQQTVVSFIENADCREDSSSLYTRIRSSNRLFEERGTPSFWRLFCSWECCFWKHWHLREQRGLFRYRENNKHYNEAALFLLASTEQSFWNISESAWLVEKPWCKYPFRSAPVKICYTCVSHSSTRLRMPDGQWSQLLFLVRYCFAS